MHLHIKLTRPGAKPFLRNPEDPEAAGFDIFTPEAVTIEALNRKLILTGVATEFAKGWVGSLRDRSGLANKGLHVFGGVIDSSYRKEWGVILYNSNPYHFSFNAGDRIAQVLFQPVAWPEIVIIEGELSPSDRGEKGFGSSGC